MIYVFSFECIFECHLPTMQVFTVCYLQLKHNCFLTLAKHMKIKLNKIQFPHYESINLIANCFTNYYQFIKSFHLCMYTYGYGMNAFPHLMLKKQQYICTSRKVKPFEELLNIVYYRASPSKWKHKYSTLYAQMKKIFQYSIIQSINITKFNYTI